MKGGTSLDKTKEEELKVAREFKTLRKALVLAAECVEHAAVVLVGATQEKNRSNGEERRNAFLRLWVVDHQLLPA
jgi:hypothetical protein